MKYIYPALFCENELGGYSVEFPDFECCATDGDNIQETVFMASEALELAIEGEIELGKELPAPSWNLGEGKERVIFVCVDIDARKLAVTSKTAAHLLDVSPARVRQLVATGQLASEKRGRDNYVYLWSIQERKRTPRSAGRPSKEASARLA